MTFAFSDPYTQERKKSAGGKIQPADDNPWGQFATVFAGVLDRAMGSPALGPKVPMGPAAISPLATAPQAQAAGQRQAQQRAVQVQEEQLALKAQEMQLTQRIADMEMQFKALQHQMAVERHEWERGLQPTKKRGAEIAVESAETALEHTIKDRPLVERGLEQKIEMGDLNLQQLINELDNEPLKRQILESTALQSQVAAEFARSNEVLNQDAIRARIAASQASAAHTAELTSIVKQTRDGTIGATNAENLVKAANSTYLYEAMVEDDGALLKTKYDYDKQVVRNLYSEALIRKDGIKTEVDIDRLNKALPIVMALQKGSDAPDEDVVSLAALSAWKEYGYPVTIATNAQGMTGSPTETIQASIAEATRTGNIEQARLMADVVDGVRQQISSIGTGAPLPEGVAHLIPPGLRSTLENGTQKALTTSNKAGAVVSPGGIEPVHGSTTRNKYFTSVNLDGQVRQLPIIPLSDIKKSPDALSTALAQRGGRFNFILEMSDSGNITHLHRPVYDESGDVEIATVDLTGIAGRKFLTDIINSTQR